MRKLNQIVLVLCAIPILANAQGDKLPNFELHNRPTIVNVTDSTGAIVSINFIDTLTGKVRSNFDLYKRCPFLKDAEVGNFKIVYSGDGYFMPKDKVIAEKYKSKIYTSRFDKDEFSPEINDFDEITEVEFHINADIRVDTGYTYVSYSWKSYNNYETVLGAGSIIYILNDKGKIVDTIITDGHLAYYADISSDGRIIGYQKAFPHENEKPLGEFSYIVRDVKKRKTVLDLKEINCITVTVSAKGWLKYVLGSGERDYRFTLINPFDKSMYSYNFQSYEGDYKGVYMVKSDIFLEARQLKEVTIIPFSKLTKEKLK